MALPKLTGGPAALAAGGDGLRFGGRRGAPLAVFRRLRRNAQEKKQP